MLDIEPLSETSIHKDVVIKMSYVSNRSEVSQIHMRNADVENPEEFGGYEKLHTENIEFSINLLELSEEVHQL